LNASNNEPLPGCPIYTTDDEFDISHIDPLQYPSIKLKAEFKRNQTSAPILHYWGVSWNASNAWRDTLFGELKGTTHNLTSGDGELWQKTSPTDFYKYSSNPLVKNGPAASWDDISATRPSIVYNGTGYMMWYEGRPGSTKWQIGLATSPDGITWTKYSGNPVLSLGSGGAWDSDYVGMPWVLFDGETYKMWYGGEKGTTWKIGYATSIDGINWQKYSNNPILDLGLSGSWDDAEVKDPCVLFNGIMYKMWFTGMKESNHVNKVGYATSYDGINWTKYPNNPIISGPTSWNNGIRSMHILHEFNNYLGWFTNKGSEMEIYYTHSPDGVSWNNFINNPILQKSPSSSWDDAKVITSRVIKKDKQYYMYYAGSDGTNQQIGLAKSKFTTNGVITTETITIPDTFRYDTLIMNKTEPSGTAINYSILDGITETPIPNLENLRYPILDISGISPINYPTIKIQVNFESTGKTIQGINTPVLYDLSLNWTKILRSRIINITVESDPEANRTFSAGIQIDLVEYQGYGLPNLSVEYQAPTDIKWHTGYISGLHYDGEMKLWYCNFIPPAEAKLGLYKFRFICYDSLGDFDFIIKPGLIRVINNKPLPPEVLVTPEAPKTLDNLVVHRTTNSTDIETPDSQIQYWYRWYRNEEYSIEFENITIIPYTYTIKGEHWRSEVYPFDNDDLGYPGEDSVVILNSPPKKIKDFETVVMLEDSKKVLDDLLLQTFADDDNDKLVFNSSTGNYITVNIFQDNGTIELIPTPDWFGTEYITFSANDSLAMANATMKIIVNPTNDLPRIVQVGYLLAYQGYPELAFYVNEDAWLNLTILVEDIDGDVERNMIGYSINVTNFNKFNLVNNKLFFNPHNEDVGWHYLNISVTDNNETPIQYVSQHIRIRVFNVNDPPAVKIIKPVNNQEFMETEFISFACEADDVDLLVWESIEKLNYRWLMNSPIIGRLGSSQNLTNLTLPPGNYNISVIVIDRAGAEAADYVKIIIKAKAEEKEKPTIETNYYFWLGLIILVILIILILTLLFGLSRKKK
ncbi:MAG: hypothetical protein KAJ51_09755, partial [Thermoplasmata archaeon]|nr:hypothetical protein [Thermoplasmata archaeon]